MQFLGSNVVEYVDAAQEGQPQAHSALEQPQVPMAVSGPWLFGLVQRKAAPLGVGNRRKRNTKLLLLRDRDESDKERERERSDELSPPPAGSNPSKPWLVAAAVPAREPAQHLHTLLQLEIEVFVRIPF